MIDATLKHDIAPGDAWVREVERELAVIVSHHFHAAPIEFGKQQFLFDADARKQHPDAQWRSFDSFVLKHSDCPFSIVTSMRGDRAANDRMQGRRAPARQAQGRLRSSPT